MSSELAVIFIVQVGAACTPFRFKNANKISGFYWNFPFLILENPLLKAENFAHCPFWTFSLFR
jgi:hypothetical protein